MFDNVLVPLMVYLLLQDYHRCYYSHYIAVEELFCINSILFVDVIEVKGQTKGQ